MSASISWIVDENSGASGTVVVVVEVVVVVVGAAVVVVGAAVVAGTVVVDATVVVGSGTSCVGAELSTGADEQAVARIAKRSAARYPTRTLRDLSIAIGRRPEPQGSRPLPLQSPMGTVRLASHRPRRQPPPREEC